MRTRYSSVNFGEAYAGLATVGYALYNFDATLKTARKTSGVSEVGTSTGIYATSFSVDDGWDGIVLWDTGGASPVYGQDEKFSQINAIQDQTNDIRIIWNTLKNRFDYEGEISLKLQSLIDKKQITEEDIKKAIKMPEMPSYEAEFGKVMDSITSIEKAVSVAPVDYTSVLHGNKEELKETIAKNVKKIKFPDYSKELQELTGRLIATKEAIDGMANQAQDIKKSIPKYDGELSGIMASIIEAGKELNNLKDYLEAINTNIKTVGDLSARTVMATKGTEQKVDKSYEGLQRAVDEGNKKIYDLEKYIKILWDRLFPKKPIPLYLAKYKR